jgi:hypothetical protein
MHMTAIFSGLLIVVLGAEPGGMGLPFGIPPATEDPVIARVAPEKCLLYINWAGTASPDGSSLSQAEQLLAEPEVQQFLAAVGNCLRVVAKSEVHTGEPAAAKSPTQFSTADAFECFSGLVTHPTAIFISDLTVAKRKPEDATAAKPKPAPGAKEATRPEAAKPAAPAPLVPPQLEGLVGACSEAACQFDTHAGMVVCLSAQAAQFKAAADKFLKAAMAEQHKGIGEALHEVQIAGQTWYQWKAQEGQKAPGGGVPVTLGVKGDYFIVGIGDGTLQAILARMEKKAPPAWLTAALAKVPVPRRTGVVYFNLKALGQFIQALTDAAETKEKGQDARAVLGMLGLDNADALIHTVGLDANGYVNKVLLALDGPPRGLLRLVSDRPLRPEDLAAIPRDATVAIALRVDLQQALDIVLSSVEKLSPAARAEANQVLDGMERNLGISVRRGLLGSLGDTWCIYNSPGEGGFWLTGLTAVVPLRNHPAFSLAYAKLLDLAKTNLSKGRTDLSDLGLPGLKDFRHFTFAGREVCYVSADWLSPSWCMTPTEIVMALNVHNVKAYLSRREPKSLAALPEVAAALPASGGPVALAYVDTPKLFELLYPFVGMLVQGIVDSEASPTINLDQAAWPSAPAVARHLRPDLTTLERNRHGIQVTCHSVFPTGIATMPVGFSSMSLIPFFMTSPVLALPPQPAEVPGKAAPTKPEPPPAKPSGSPGAPATPPAPGAAVQDAQSLIFTAENVRLMQEEWERFWLLDRLDHNAVQPSRGDSH